MAISMDPYATVQTIERSTYDLQENLYVRVVGPYNLTTPFSLDVAIVGGVCRALQTVPSGLAAIAGPAPAAGTHRSLILTHSGRLPGSAAEIATALTDLQTLAGRSDVDGVVIDLADARYQRVTWANAQADQYPTCPSAKNTVAREIKSVIDAYQTANAAGGATTLKYIVLAGGASAIPFFQTQDVAGLASEKEYIAPVAPSTPSEAEKRAGLVQGQDGYGAQVNLRRGDRTIAIPNLAVGRLVERASDISAAVNRYIATGGVVVPRSALVTGYDFVGDAALAIKSEVEAGTASSADTLIQAPGLPPSDPSAWTADQLRAKLLTGRHDLAVLSGHFSAGNLLAADYSSTLTADEVARSPADLSNAIILALGCHGGYSIPSSDLLAGASPDPDWAKAFLRKGAAGFVAATGYAYGDTELTEYGERLFVNLAGQLRAGSGPVALGDALVAAKLQYLAQTAQLSGIDEKTVAEMTLYGLPMMKVNMPGGRSAPPTETPIVTTTAPASSGPGASIGLSSTAAALDPLVTLRTKTLVNLANGSTVTTSYLVGADGVVANPYEPIYPKQRYNVSIAGKILRGVAFRGGSYNDVTDIVPLTSAPATETSSAHKSYSTDVFYPNQTWMPNYYDAIGGGPTRLIAIPAQFQSRAPGSIDGTLRTFSTLNMRLYYLPSDWVAAGSDPIVKAAAVSAAPTILGASARVSNGNVTFSVSARADGSAGVQEVWVLYTGAPGSPYYGQWLPLDLTQDADAPTQWSGALALQPGASAQDLQFMVQAVGGAGLTVLGTNLGAYYRVTDALVVAPQPAATTLVLESPSVAGTYLQPSTFTLLLTAGGQPLASKQVALDIGGQQAQAVTGADGRATISLSPLVVPGGYTVQASFRGDARYRASSASSAFALAKDSTTVSVAPPSASVAPSQTTPFVAVVRDSAGRALGGKSVFFVIRDSAQAIVLVRSAIADYLGGARLGALPLPAGSYSVDAYFSGAIPLPAGRTLAFSDDGYASSLRLGAALTIGVADADPPTIVASATIVGGAPYSVGSWTNQTVTVRFVCSDAASGVASCPADQIFASDGRASASGVARDNAGNSASASFGPILVDTTAPSTVGGAVSGGNQATVTLTASDRLSGVANTVYWVNGGAAQRYSGPFGVGGAGSYVITYVSTDNAGNAEPTQTLRFTVSGVLDSFRRADGGLGGSWGGATGARAYQIANNHLDVQLGGPIYWKSAFGPNQEAFVTLTTIDARSREQGVLLKVQTGGAAQIGGIAVVYDAVAQAVRVETLRLGAFSWTLYANRPASFSNGDRLGARALSDGTVLIFKNGAPLTSVVLSSTDRRFFNDKGGAIGLWAIGAPNALLNDFGGGTLTP